MSDEPETLGDNQSADLNSRVDQIIGLREQIDELKDREKEIKANAKADGYNVKAINQVVKEKRKGIEFQAAQLRGEVELDAYRKAAGVQTDAGKAQDLADKEAERNPDQKVAERKKKGRSAKVFDFPGKPN